ncbi:hypothetical protein Daus18300_008191 [Diaporthe australafricana]|uniref:Heterokaryon incompatibility domain-containing protein n=1 Tax=Diaporthe australafricana TaxID=127596 RepID=A0ABR3WJ79_9PEZI
MGCGICRLLYEELMASLDKDLLTNHEKDQERAPEQLEDNKIETVLTAHSTALLAIVYDIEDDDVFRLDFKLEWTLGKENPNTVKRTFVLKQTVWYPTRLVDIRAFKSQTYLDTRRKQYTGNVPEGRETLQDLNKITVRLVERSRDDPQHGLNVYGEDLGQSNQPNNLYVTLSHCWGKSQHYTLDPDTEDELKEGVEVEKLPKTFRDAINFASQLHNVGWIWIDSLCIYQAGPERDKDWLEEAALMQRVYQESYLNISATAASNSSMGLYSYRDCRTLWENEVSLKVDGIPGLALHEKDHHHSRGISKEEAMDISITSLVCKWFGNVFNNSVSENEQPIAKIDWGGEKPLTLALPEPEGLRRCILIDTSHWDNLVNKAPVNVRAWVLQERLLAPRVLHFCEGSIAWECAGFTRAEGHPTGLPRFQVQHDRILPEVSLKGLDPFKHGKKLRSIRLGKIIEPDSHIPEKDLYGFELWARVVEMYSKMNLTMAKDKLIALSGIAQLMSTRILGSEEDPARYVAGLWYKYLESQLLWRVEPIFIRHNRTFHQPARRPADYRAPSFSWASVDAQNGIADGPGNGVTYGEVTDRDLLIDINEEEEDVVINTQTDNTLGLVTGGHIMLQGKLRKIRLSRGDRGRFYWRLLERNGVCPKLDQERHHNVYLDAPSDDDTRHGIFESDNLYCLPAARGPRSENEESKYIICLILQQATGDVQVADLELTRQKGTFRRIGLAKLSSWGDKHTYQHILTPHATDTQLPHWPFGFDTSTNRHLIRVI